MENESVNKSGSESRTLKATIILLSPLFVNAVSLTVAHIFKPIWEVWAWVPGILIYWMIISFLILWGGGKTSIRKWLGPSQGRWGWAVLALILALPPLQMFLTKGYLLKGISIWLPWLLLGLINPFLEEGYWRGLVLDSAANWSKWLAVSFSSAFFTLNHLVGLGATSIACRNPVFLANVFIIGIIFGIIYYKTRSLRWLILSHGLTDLFSLSVPVFLNLYIPPR